MKKTLRKSLPDSKVGEPHILRQDEGGQWYLIPESKKLRFAEVLYKLDDWDLFDHEFSQYAIDGPFGIKIYK